MLSESLLQFLIVYFVSLSILDMNAGVYLCVKMYGNHNATFSLRGVLSECPSDFTKKGEQRICSTLKASSEKRHTGCNSDGSCICKDPFKKPIAIPYAGQLGSDSDQIPLSIIPMRTDSATHCQ